MPVLAKTAYSHGLTVSQLLPVRFWLAAFGLAVLAVLFERHRLRGAGVHLPGAVVLGILYAVQTVLFFVALQSTPASIAVLLFFTFPTMIAVAAWLFLSRPFTSALMAALVTGLLGLALTVGGAEIGSAVGVFLVIAAAVANAWYFLYAETRMRGAPNLLVCAAGLAVGAGLLTVLMLIRGDPLLPTTVTGWALLGGLAVVPIVGLPTLLVGLTHLGATSSAVLSTWEPVLAVWASVVVLSEPFTVAQIAGALLVVLSVVLAQRIPIEDSNQNTCTTG
jgi:drug/metabolite transporter (DMT)-like permease